MDPCGRYMLCTCYAIDPSGVDCVSGPFGADCVYGPFRGRLCSWTLWGRIVFMDGGPFRGRLCLLTFDGRYVYGPESCYEPLVGGRSYKVDYAMLCDELRILGPRLCDL